MAVKEGLPNTCWKFRNKPVVLFTLVMITLIWMSKDNFESNWRPKCFGRLALLRTFMAEWQTIKKIYSKMHLDLCDNTYPDLTTFK